MKNAHLLALPLLLSMGCARSSAPAHTPSDRSTTNTVAQQGASPSSQLDASTRTVDEKVSAEPAQLDTELATITRAVRAITLAPCGIEQTQGHAILVFTPSGKVSSATVDEGPLKGTPKAGCVAGKLRVVVVPPPADPHLTLGVTFGAGKPHQVERVPHAEVSQLSLEQTL